MSIENAIGWALVHSIWEIAAIALLLFVATLALRRASSNVRYGIALVALCLCFASPIATYLVVAPKTAPIQAIPTATFAPKLAKPTLHTQAPTFSTPSESASLSSRLEAYLPSVVICWLIGLAVMSIRLAGGLVMIARLRRNVASESDPRWVNLTYALCKRFGIRRCPTLRMSDKVDTPAVIGTLRAMILFPASLATRLSFEDVEALLAHELAHIRRHDYVVNLLQSVIETVLFYHPAIWWISGIVRKEREHCCDDMAIQVIGSKQQYARALVGLEQTRHPSPRLAMAARNGDLLSRIRRILVPSDRSVAPTSIWLTLFLVVSISIGFAQSLRANPTNSKAQDMQIISGQVVDEADKPIQGATVVCQITSLGTMKVKLEKTESDRNGRYQFSIPKLAATSLLAFQGDKFVGLSDLSGKKTTVIKLVPSHQLRVKVVDRTGAPVAGMPVAPDFLNTPGYVTYLMEEARNFFVGVTDQSGIATLSNMPVKGRSTLTGWTDRLVTESEGRSFELDQPQQIKLIAVRSAKVFGKVTLQGKPIAGVAVVATSPSRGYRSTITDSDGNYDLPHLLPGGFMIWGMLPQGLGDDWILRRAAVTAVTEKSKRIDLKVERGALVSGNIEGGKHRPARVSIRFLDKSIPNDSTTPFGMMVGADGSFSKRIPAGSYDITVHDRGQTAVTPVVVHDGESKKLVLNAPNLDNFSVVHCLLLDENGNPVPNRPMMYGFSSGPMQSIVATDGKGEAELNLTKEEAKTVWFFANVGGQFSAQRVRPKNGSAVIRLHRVALGGITGVINDASGKPMRNARVTIGFNGQQGDTLGDLDALAPWDRRTGPDGTFHFKGIYPGTQAIIMVRALGHADYQCSTLTVNAGKDVRLSPITLAKGHSIYGKVVDQFNKPIENAQVWVNESLRVSDFSVRTDKQGRFMYDRIPAGSYKMSIFKGYKETHVRGTTDVESVFRLKL